MGFMQVPDEILIDIIKTLDQDQPSLCRIPLISHRFARIVREILPRRLELTVRSYEMNDLQKCRRYLRSCDEDPRLSGRTQSARLCWNQVFDGSGPYHLLNELLMRLTALRKLELTTNLSDTNDLLHHLRRNPQLKLQDLRIDTPGLRYEHILVFLKLPSIQVIYCRRLLDSSMAKPRSLPYLPSFESTKKFTLRSVQMEALNAILSGAPLLQELVIGISSRMMSSSRPARLVNGYCMSSIVSST